jgi:hypothetical protein
LFVIVFFLPNIVLEVDWFKIMILTWPPSVAKCRQNADLSMV